MKSFKERNEIPLSGYNWKSSMKKELIFLFWLTEYTFNYKKKKKI